MPSSRSSPASESPIELVPVPRTVVLLLAVPLGVIGNSLLRVDSPGVAAALWVLLVAAAASLVRARFVSRAEGRRDRMLHFWIPVLAFAACTAWRESNVLNGVAFLGLVSAALLPLLRPITAAIASFRVEHYLACAAELVLNCAILGFELITPRPAAPRELGEAANASASGRRYDPARAASIGKGFISAFFLVAVFGGLFMSADAVFADFIVGTFTLDYPHFLGQAFWSLAIAWLVGGYLAGLVRELGFLWSPDPTRERAAANRRANRPWEVLIPLTSLNLLYVSFIAVQLRYLFGGAALVEARLQLSYAEYARRGFFELVTAAALALLVLLISNPRLCRGTRFTRVAYRTLTLGLVACVAVTMVSALQRMSIYVEAYGLTELRVYTTAFMGWIAILLAWYSITSVRERSCSFAYGAVLSAYAIAIALHAIDPDRLIARTNLTRARSSSAIDLYYLTTLSRDAWPVLLDAIDERPPDQQRELARSLLAAWERDRDTSDWRSWTLARGRTDAAMEQARAKLERYAARD